VSEQEYDAWADYYDIIHKGLPGEAEFYIAQAIRSGGETFELGCGTGRICIPMAMSGVNVTGLDNSANMLDICREKKEAIGETSGCLTLIKADMRDFDLKKKFQFIAMPYRAFMHLLTPEDQRGCLRKVHEHLADDGVFIMNLWAARSVRIMKDFKGLQGVTCFSGRYPIPDGSGELVHYQSVIRDDERQLLEEEHIVHHVNEEGTVIHTAVLPMTRIWLKPLEMQQILTQCSFAVEAVFGDFDCTVLNDDSEEMIWVLRKEKNSNVS